MRTHTNDNIIDFGFGDYGNTNQADAWLELILGYNHLGAVCEIKFGNAWIIANGCSNSLRFQH